MNREDSICQICVQRLTMSVLLLSALFMSSNDAFTLPTVNHRIEWRTTHQVDSRILGGPTKPSHTAVPVEQRLWPGARVPYKTNSNLENLLPNVLGAMRKIQNRTCVRFVEATATDNDYISIILKEGCWSFVGRARGVQELSLGHPCGDSIGVVLHELLHSLGLWHEHARSDRDEYVDVLWDNIEEGEKSNFQKFHPWENNLLDEPFDFDSIMMYGGQSFSKDGVSPTLVSRVTGKQLVDLAERTELSEGDIRRINKLYECQGETRPTAVDVPALDCPFYEDTCGFSSQIGDSLTEWKLNRGPNGGMYLSFNRGHPQTTGYLFSPYMKPYLRDRGCLSFSYIFEGPAVKGFRLLRQTEMEEQDILGEYEGPDSEGWIDEYVEITFREDFRLVFHGIIANGSRNDVILLADLKFEWKPCR